MVRYLLNVLFEVWFEQIIPNGTSKNSALQYADDFRVKLARLAVTYPHGDQRYWTTRNSKTPLSCTIRVCISGYLFHIARNI